MEGGHAREGGGEADDDGVDAAAVVEVDAQRVEDERLRRGSRPEISFRKVPRKWLEGGDASRMILARRSLACARMHSAEP